MGSKINIGGEVYDIDIPAPGFAEHKLYTPSKGSRLYDVVEEPESFVKVRPPYVGHGAPAEPPEWPRLTLSRKFDVRRAGKEWRKFEKEFQIATVRHGAAVELGKMSLEYISADEFSSLFTKRYPNVARDKNPGRAKRQAREVIDKVNGRIQEVRYDSNRSVLDDEAWNPNDFLQRADALVASDIDGGGPGITVLPLMDMDRQFKRERDQMLEILSEKQFGFNVSQLDQEWQPEVVILIAHDNLPPRRTSFNVPSYPVYMPLDIPKVHREAA